MSPGQWIRVVRPLSSIMISIRTLAAKATRASRDSTRAIQRSRIIRRDRTQTMRPMVPGRAQSIRRMTLERTISLGLSHNTRTPPELLRTGITNLSRSHKPTINLNIPCLEPEDNHRNSIRRVVIILAAAVAGYDSSRCCRCRHWLAPWRPLAIANVAICSGDGFE